MRKQKTEQQKIRNTHRNHENIFHHKADKPLEVLTLFFEDHCYDIPHPYRKDMY